MRLLIHFILNLLAAAFTAWMLPGVSFTSFSALLLAVIVLGLINTLIRPVVSLITLPINILTLGLFGLVLNGLFILLVAELVSGFLVSGFWWALAFSLVLSFVSGFLHLFEHKRA